MIGRMDKMRVELRSQGATAEEADVWARACVRTFNLAMEVARQVIEAQVLAAAEPEGRA